MNKKTIFKICIDICMTAVLLFLMSYSITGEKAHEVLGIIMFTLLIIHHLLNLNWIKNLNKGRYTLFRKVQAILNFLILFSVIGSMISGIILSKHLFTFIRFTSLYSPARVIHFICGYWGFVLISLHLGFHWNIMVSMAGKIFTDTSKKRTYIARLFAAAIVCYGIYAAIKRNYFEYLFMLNQFAFFDTNEPVIFFIADYMAIMGIFVCIGHYTGRSMIKSS